MPSEKELQASAIRALVQQGYAYEGADHDEDWLRSNFFEQVERFNHDVLGRRLSDTEKERLWTLLPNNFKDDFSILRHGLTLYLDDNREVNIGFLDTKNIDANILQVTEELHVAAAHRTRLDLVIIINGLPILNGELKRTGSAHGADEALDQINRYNSAGVYRQKLMRFIQVFFISDDITTKYFAASPKGENKQPYKKAFPWGDVENNHVHNLKAFIDSFLHPATLVSILSKYMLVTTGSEDKEPDTFILRPYQFYAVNRARAKLLNSDDNLFIWHATGSGKTLTSYILAHSLSEEQKYAKTVMLLDRNDLADQTILEYAEFNSEFVKTASRGRELHEQMMNPNVKFIMTTMQSFNRWVERHGKAAVGLNQKPFCFVVDECHRTTFGDMFKLIRKTFTRSQFVGFTGTPRLAENPTDNDQLTKNIFGEAEHIYTIKDAIGDGNVLPFAMNEVLIEPKAPTSDMKLDKNYYAASERMDTICAYVANNLYKHTEQQDLIKARPVGYTAMVAAQSKREAYRYWDNLTPVMEKQNRKTALVYSITDNTEDQGEGTEVTWYLRVLEKHDKNFGTDFAEKWKTDRSNARKEHVRDVVKRTKNREIDLLIVSDMLLTGFDAPTLNTIYLDKNLDLHNLLQAMSRTNRTHPASGKQTGNVMLFSDRKMTDAVDESIRLFSNGKNVDGVLERKNYTNAYNDTVDHIQNLKKLAPQPTDVSAIYDAEEFKKVARAFSGAKSSIRNLKTYDEWEPNDWQKLDINQDTIDEYYAHIYETSKKFVDSEAISSDTLAEIGFLINSFTEYKIDVSYIIDLLRALQYSPKRVRERELKRVLKAIDTSDDPAVMEQAEAFKNVANAIRNEEITNETEMAQRLMVEQMKLDEARIIVAADELGIPVEDFRSMVDLKRSGHIDHDQISKVLREQGLALRDLRAKKEQILKLLTTKFM